MYQIIYKNEVVDETETRKEAEFLSKEYSMAFNYPCRIKEVLT